MKKYLLPLLTLFCSLFLTEAHAVRFGYYGEVVGVSSVVGMHECLIFDIAIFHDHGTPWDPTDDVLITTATIFGAGCDGIIEEPTEPSTLNHHLVIDSATESSGCSVLYFSIIDNSTNDPVAYGEKTVDCSSSKRLLSSRNELIVRNNYVENLLYVENSLPSNFTAQIISINGKVLNVLEIEPQHLNTFNLTNLSQGIYFCTIMKDGMLIQTTKIYKN